MPASFQKWQAATVTFFFPSLLSPLASPEVTSFLSKLRCSGGGPAGCNRGDERRGKDDLLLPLREGPGGEFCGVREPPAASCDACGRELEKWNGDGVVTDTVPGIEGTIDILLLVLSMEKVLVLA